MYRWIPCLCSALILTLPTGIAARAAGAGPEIRGSIAERQEPAANRECQLRSRIPTTVVWRGPYARGYEVFGNREHGEALTIAVEHEGAACSFRLDAIPEEASAPSLRSGEHRLRYTLSDHPAGSAFRFGTDAETLLSGAFPEGSGRDARTLYIVLPAGQMVPGGTEYSSRLIFRLYREGSAGSSLIQEQVTTVTASVPSILQAVIANSTGETQNTFIDFKKLEEGARRSSTLRIRSNGGVTVAFTSQNGGRLRHGLADATIAYDLQVDGRRAELSTPGGVLEIAPAGMTGERTITLDFTITGTVKGMPAGKYEDTLTAVFTTRH